MTADVNRWHSNPDPRLRKSGDTINAHQVRVANLCSDLCKAMGIVPSYDMMLAARNHDEAERVLGDIPGPAKQRFPALAAAYAKAELEVMTNMGLQWSLSRQEADILDLCDKLDALIWAVRIQGFTQEWCAAELHLRAKAKQIDAEVWLSEKIASIYENPSVCQFGG
jgi:5'-deoxynucleotidase YfbR-like HD superfamily hydrolase